ncbi:MAG TPA: RNA polymerase factor sigma-32 [Methylovirgula sp.]|jgi:RNA polymerase sigma-32 factor|nr:RNA polymerase factor sigma-32 [Methylovirgula sp.]
MAYLMGVGRQLVEAAKSAPFLEREEERALAVSWKEKRDERALHKLTQAHMRLVIALAVRFRHYGLPIADLIQEGHVGLLEAAARFDPEREVRFSTYATWWIRAAMQDYILRNWSIVRGGTSSAQKALFFNLRRLRAQLANTSGGGTAIVFDRIAETLGVSRSDVEFMDSRLSVPDMSLNAPVSDSDPSVPSQRMDFLPDDGPLPDEIVAGNIDSDRRSGWLADAMAGLSQRELDILKERRLTENAATLESLGDRLGISKERVRQIENRALEKLRRALIDQHPQERRNHAA